MANDIIPRSRRARRAECPDRGKKNSLVRAIDIVNGQNGQIAIVPEIAKGNARARLDLSLGDKFLRNIQCDRHGEDVAIGETAVGDNSNPRKHLSVFRSYLPWK